MKRKIEEGKVRNGSILETDKERDELVAGKIRRTAGEGRRVTGLQGRRRIEEHSSPASVKEGKQIVQGASAFIPYIEKQKISVPDITITAGNIMNCH